jgi:hypothetical protein
LNIILKMIMRWHLRGFWKREKIKIPELQKTIDTIKREYKRARDADLEHYTRFYNVSLFILVMDYDMSILSQYYVESCIKDKDWEKKYIARQIAVSLYEASEDIPQLLGKGFRASLRTIPLWDEAENELNEITKKLDQFKQSHKKILGELRNFVAAHRDHDAFKQMEIIDDLNPDSIYALLGDFYDIVNPLVSFMTHIVSIMGNPYVIVHHLSERDAHLT